MIAAIRKQEDRIFCIGLNHKEVSCKCNYPSCSMTMIDQNLVRAYEKLRSKLALPIKINSGYRCALHNFEVGGASLSMHMQGKALDICKTSFIDKMSVTEFTKLARECGFTFIKEYSSFLHADIRK